MTAAGIYVGLFTMAALAWLLAALELVRLFG